jgi:hypothetical protein
MDNQQTLEKLSNYSGSNSFILSLKYQAKKYGQLSPKQLECAVNFFTKQEATKEFTYKVRQTITIRKWLAQSLAKTQKLPFFFRNLVIEEVVSESNRAIQVKVSFSSKIASVCHCCGRGLDNQISKATGIGPVCAKKYFKIERPTIDKAQEIIAKIEEEAKIAGIIGPIWIPKSQIVSDVQKILFGDD